MSGSSRPSNESRLAATMFLAAARELSASFRDMDGVQAGDLIFAACPRTDRIGNPETNNPLVDLAGRRRWGVRVFTQILQRTPI